MNNTRRDMGHAFKLAPIVTLAALLPLAFLSACSSGISGHAPGLAGEQAQDPGTLNFPLAYIKRPPPAKDIDARDLITSTTGGDLFIRQQASAGSPEINITGTITMGKGDVRDLDVSVDGKKLVFSLRLPLNPNKPNTDKTQPTWKIYQYDAVAKTTTQLTNDNTTAGHDITPHYLPDGRIVFASTRQAATQAILIDEGRPQYPAQTQQQPTQPIFLLHVMNADGTSIHQISFNTDHDFNPAVLANGQIVFSRIDAQNGGQISLYRANPDGTALELLYGENSHMTGANRAGTNNNVIQFLRPRERADGKVISVVRPFMGTQGGGDLVAIDTTNFVEINQASTPAAPSGVGQASATTLGVTTDADAPSFGGWFHSAYPLLDGTNRMLVSWAPCLVLDNTQNPPATVVCNNQNTVGTTTTDANGNPVTTVPLAPPQYTLWLYDNDKGTLSPILGAESGMTVVEPVIMQARTPVPTFIADAQPTGAAADLAQNSGGALGLLEIRSVYDFDGTDTVATQTGNTVTNIAALADPKQATADQRPARFLRVQKAVEIPDNKIRKINNSAFGPTGNGMREILAYVPVQPDGSVKVELPANVPFTIDILDKNGRRISAPHVNWLQLMPGETKQCNGCHLAGMANTTHPSHGRSGLTTSAWAGAQSAGAPFPNTLASLPVGNVGDTMADTLALNTCRAGAGTTCAQIPSIDVIYADVWTDPVAAGRPADTSFSYLYSDLSTPKPANANCGTWGALCRSTIHYPMDNGAGINGHIQPIWSFARTTVAADGTILSDHTCTTCHNPVNAAGQFQVPAGQLDLTTAASGTDPTITVSYEDLLFQHNELTLNMGVLQPVTVPDPNSTTGGTQPVMVAAAMSAGSALGSEANFFSKFDGSDHGVTTDHTGWLTPAELRLISEWLDIGAQFYNDPFVAPTAN